MSSFVVSLFLIVVFFLCTDAALSFKSVSLDATSSNLRFRALSFNAFSLAGLFSGTWYSSLEVDVDSKNLTVDGDFIWGATYVMTGGRPSHWHGYWNAHVEADRHIDPDTTAWVDFNASLSSSFIASSYLNLIEKNGTDVIDIYPLNGLWVYNKKESEAQTNISAGLHSAIFDGVLKNFQKVRLEFIATEYSGVLDILGGIRVVPKAIETIFSIPDWKYENPENHLTLQIGVGSAQFTASSDGQVKSGPSGLDQVYFYCAKEAYLGVKQEPQSVTITQQAATEISALGSKQLEGQLQARFGASASVQLIEISFPVNAVNIVYDPTIGSGESPYESSEVGMIVAIVVVVSFVLFAIIAIAAYVFWGKRSSYESLG